LLDFGIGENDDSKIYEFHPFFFYLTGEVYGSGVQILKRFLPSTSAETE
jgi:hypothetical protein